MDSTFGWTLALLAALVLATTVGHTRARKHGMPAPNLRNQRLVMGCVFSLLTANLLLGAAAGLGPQEATVKPIERSVFGHGPGGQEAGLYLLTNQNGLQASITNFGGTLVALRVPDKQGNLGDVVLGYDSFDGYFSDSAYFGASIGRYANRIAHGKFSLAGVTYLLAKNNGENSLHGGVKGFNKVFWQATEIADPDGPSLQLKYTSKDGEEGYPGNLAVTVVFTLTHRNELKIDYTATTDKTTVLNLTNHSYFNLAGPAGGDILKHELTINAAQFTPVDSGLIPTGELRGVKGTPFDFQQSTSIGAHRATRRTITARQRLRPQLGVTPWRKRQFALGRSTVRAILRALDGSLDHRTRPAVLHRKFPGWLHPR